ncbi:MAG: tRNA (adenosine(37)-N6)-threonylcarbamoyltransferase complex dimerization subunit type 1 TsaB [Candidatus Binatia bacterium]
MLLAMMILGIDTAATMASAALVEEGKLVLEEVQPIAPQCGGRASPSARANHAATLLPLIDRLFHKAGISFEEISALAVSLGPGSFTGLRIGLSTVKGLAYGWNIPVVGVPTLPATAARVTEREGLICPFLDARKGEVYTSLFTRQGQRLERMTPDLVAPPEKIIERVRALHKGESSLFIGDGTKIYGDLIRSSLGAEAVLTLGEEYPSTASAVARLGEEKVHRGDVDPLGPLVPFYLRLSEAELKKA